MISSSYADECVSVVHADEIQELSFHTIEEEMGYEENFFHRLPKPAFERGQDARGLLRCQTWQRIAKGYVNKGA